jgi:aquaporin Z
MSRKLAAEFFGTFWLVFGGCGSAVLAAAFPQLGIGFAGVAFAFGLTVLTMAFAVGGISGGHFNPAVSLGLAIANRFEWSELIPYWIVQVVGGFVGAAVLYVIASGAPNFAAGGFASNGYDALSPGHYSLLSCLVAEVVLTAAFLIIILGSTSKAAPAGFAPRIGADAYSSDFDPGHQYFRQPGAFDGGRPVRADRRCRSTLAVLGCSAGGSRRRRLHLEASAFAGRIPGIDRTGEIARVRADDADEVRQCAPRDRLRRRTSGSSGAISS